MNEKAINRSIKKIALVAIFLIFLVGTVSADLTIEDVKADCYYANYVSAMENNTINVTKISNDDDTATGVWLYLYASDVSEVIPVASKQLDNIPEEGSIGPQYIVDPTIRTSEETITYTATVTANGGISASKDSDDIYVRFNGYKGKVYWNGDNITTKHTYNGNYSMVYYNQTDDAYKSTSWTTRTETWTTSDLSLPAGATVEEARLYISYNWGSNSDRSVPDFVVQFNGATKNIADPSVAASYTDNSNLGSYGQKMYGLISVDVTSNFTPGSDNTLSMARQTDNMALYPSTLVVIYSDPNATRKKILINEECDELLVSNETKKYGTTMEEATAYAPFSLSGAETSGTGVLYSFVASAGTQVDPSHIGNEGNLDFNGNPSVTYAWAGTKNSAYPYVLNINSLQTENLASIQGTSTTGMLAIEQILVVEY